MIYDRFSDTGRFAAFRCDWKDGDPCRPHIFWDSDVAKWIEAASYSIQLSPDKELEKKIDDTVDLIEKNQCDDGYFNIFHMVVEPENKFKIRDHHELYCAGHLIEASKDTVVQYCLKKNKREIGSDKITNIFKYVIPESIFVTRDCRVAIMCRYKFDAEHGIAVVYKQGKLKEVGNQDIIL